MIFVDRRIGSKHLSHHLKGSGIPVVLKTLDFGDVAFNGKGSGGKPWRVGIEIKKLPELLEPSRSRFVGFQLPGLMRSYECVVLLIESLWKPNKDGLLEVPKGSGYAPLQLGNKPVTYHEWDQFLLTLSMKTGITVISARGVSETVARIVSLYDWWAVKGYDKHASHQGFYREPKPTGAEKPSMLAEMANHLPGVGWTRAHAISEFFDHSVEHMLYSAEGAWTEIPGIGEDLAKKIYRSLHE